jgi:DNA-binding NarL/FixJ family response regulator
MPGPRAWEFVFHPQANDRIVRLAASKRHHDYHDPCLPPLFSWHEWTDIMRRGELSPRQAQVLGLVIQSHKDKEIAAILDISHATVRTHICHMKDRLAANDRVGLAYRVFWTYRHLIEPKRYPWIGTDGTK